MADNRGAARPSASQDHSAFTQSVKASLASARRKTENIRRTDSQLFMTNVVSPAAATLIATLASVIGGNNMFPQAAAQSDDGGWVVACILVAIFGFVATISGMFKKQYDDRLAQGNQCVGRLISLDLALTTGSSNWEEANKEYSEIIRSFPEFIA